MWGRNRWCIFSIIYKYVEQVAKRGFLHSVCTLMKTEVQTLLLGKGWKRALSILRLICFSVKTEQLAELEKYKPENKDGEKVN